MSATDTDLSTVEARNRARLRSIAEKLGSDLQASAAGKKPDSNPFHINLLERFRQLGERYKQVAEENRLMRHAITDAIEELEDLAMTDTLTRELFEHVRDDAEHELNYGGINEPPREGEDDAPPF